MKLTITYDIIDRVINIEENDFSALESLGILEAAKVLISEDLFEDD